MFARDGCRTNRENVIHNNSWNESLWGASVKKRHAAKRCKNASSAVNRDFGCKRGVIEGNGALDEAGAVFWQREGGVDTRCDSQNLGAVISRRVRKIGRKLQGRT